MITPDVTGEEFDVLRDHMNHGATQRMRHKAQVVMLAARGVDVDTIADIVNWAPSTITTWCRHFRQTRLGVLHDANLGNRNASKLSPQQFDEVMEVLAAPPHDNGIPIGFWTLPRLVGWIYDCFEVEYASAGSYHFLLHQAGLSFHKPEAFDKRRADEITIDHRMTQIRSELAEDHTGDNTVVFAADEVRVVHEAVLRKAWYTTGTKTKLSVDRKRQAQSYIGFLRQDCGRVELFELDWQNTDTIIDALDQLVYCHPGKKIVIVWDNAGWHRSKKLRSHLGPGNKFEIVHLINMPPYAPDHNPIEHVWGEAKDNISNIQRGSFKETKTAFSSFIRGNNFPYRI